MTDLYEVIKDFPCGKITAVEYDGGISGITIYLFRNGLSTPLCGVEYDGETGELAIFAYDEGEVPAFVHSYKF